MRKSSEPWNETAPLLAVRDNGLNLHSDSAASAGDGHGFSRISIGVRLARKSQTFSVKLIYLSRGQMGPSKAETEPKAIDRMALEIFHSLEARQFFD